MLIWHKDFDFKTAGSPLKTWCEGQPFIRCLLCANENAEGFACHSSVLPLNSGFNGKKKVKNNKARNKCFFV